MRDEAFLAAIIKESASKREMSTLHAARTPKKVVKVHEANSRG